MARIEQDFVFPGDTGWHWKEPVWRWRLGDTSFDAIEAPCWFHRLMQRWFLGIRWERIEVGK